jgi:hypothetical protein
VVEPEVQVKKNSSHILIMANRIKGLAETTLEEIKRKREAAKDREVHAWIARNEHALWRRIVRLFKHTLPPLNFAEERAGFDRAAASHHFVHDSSLIWAYRWIDTYWDDEEKTARQLLALAVEAMTPPAGNPYNLVYVTADDFADLVRFQPLKEGATSSLTAQP